MGFEIVAIGCSWGGLDAMQVILGGLGRHFRTPIVVTQHRAVHSTDALQGLLSKYGKTVCEPGDKDAIEPGYVYVAPPDYHLLVEDGHFELSVDERVSFSRPSIDVLLESAADAYGPSAIGVILTGANEDGARGIEKIKKRGGITIAQDPATAVKPAMPAAAIATGMVDKVLPLDEIASQLVELCDVPIIRPRG
jgi:two-component system, chemotaxis family, protein-glutamate methylesterase/glutaminase